MGFSGGARGGLRCFTESFDEYVADVAALSSAAVSPISSSSSSSAGDDFAVLVPRGFGPGLPLFLLGILLGGCISLHVAEDLGKWKCENLKKHFKGCILLAPMLAIDALASRGINSSSSTSGS